MQTLHISELSKKIGEKVNFNAWVQTIRDHSKRQFLVFRDLSGTVQGVAEKTPELVPALKELTHESVVNIQGLIAAEKQAPEGFEVKVEKLEILSRADPELPIPVLEKTEDEVAMDKRLDWRWLDLRKPENALMMKVWTTMEAAFREYWLKEGFLEIHSPKIMSAPSESGAELFEVQYFERKAYLAQSPQFYKQMAIASGLERVFEVGPVFRAEPSFTSRHLTEITMYDMEMAFIESHQDIIAFTENLLSHVVTRVKESHGAEIKRLYNCELNIPATPFPQVTMHEAKKILDDLKVPSQKEGDLNPEEETRLCKYIEEKQGHQFVFITEYPISVRPFYHMRKADDPNITKSFDLLFKGVELATGAQREHRLDILTKQAREKGLSEKSLHNYFNFFKYGCPAHGGFGFGPGRLVMKLLGIKNIREATYLPRNVKRLEP